MTVETAAAAPVETNVIAAATGKGRYDLRWDARLVERDGKHYLVNDEYCGEDELRGGAHRPYVYLVPTALVAIVAEHLSGYHDLDGSLDDDGEWTSERWANPMTHGEALTQMMDELHPIGEMGSRPWMASL